MHKFITQIWKIQVCACADRNVQCVRPDREIHATDRADQADIQEMAANRSRCKVLVRPCVLLHGEVLWRGLGDHANVVSWVEQWASHRLCHHWGAQRLQGLVSEFSEPSLCWLIGLKLCAWFFAGTWTECFGQYACVLPLGGHILWGCSWLDVAHRQRVVIKKCFCFCMYRKSEYSTSVKHENDNQLWYYIKSERNNIKHLKLLITNKVLNALFKMLCHVLD